MSGCKLVFRGALLPPNILSQFALQRGISKKYPKYLGGHIGPDFINLPGVTSTSTSYRVALQFSKAASEPTTAKAKTLQSVVFAICLHNFEGFDGFRMNSALYGAHPEEQEILLMEGVQVAVLGVEDMHIDNSLQADSSGTTSTTRPSPSFTSCTSKFD